MRDVWTAGYYLRLLRQFFQLQDHLERAMLIQKWCSVSIYFPTKAPFLESMIQVPEECLNRYETVEMAVLQHLSYFHN